MKPAMVSPSFRVRETGERGPAQARLPTISHKALWRTKRARPSAESRSSGWQARGR